MATLISVNVGMPKDVEWRGRTVHTGIWKAPVSGPQMVRRLNIDGDGQGDLAGHGGEQRAVLVYQLDSYRHWQRHLGRDDFEYGQFGENFTVDGLSDDDVCVGDRYGIGDAVFEVTQPRVTCFRVGMRLGEPRLPSLLVAHRRPGFYLRVIEEGRVTAGDEIVRIARGRHALSVADIDALLYLPDRDLGRLRDALDIPALSPGWQSSFREMIAAVEAGAPIDTPSFGVEPGWAGFRELAVTDVVAETPDVTSIYLASSDGTALPRSTAGQFLTLRVPDVADPAPVRSYSLSGDPTGSRYRISVKREPRGVVSAHLQATLRPGTRVEVAAPRGEFVLRDDEEPVLLVSAGIGVTPVLAMLYDLADRRSERAVWWLHTTRNAVTHAFAAEASRLLDALPNARSLVYYTARTAPPDEGSGVVSGRLTADAMAKLGLPTDASAYVCGPDAFMTDITAALVGIGIEPARIHTERFGTLAAINPGLVGRVATPPHQPPGLPGDGTAVTFARSALTTRWSAAYSSVLELAEACDVPTRWSCRTGVCHTCVTAVLAGDTAYTTQPLEPAPPGHTLICSARPMSDVVLDL